MSSTPRSSDTIESPTLPTVSPVVVEPVLSDLENEEFDGFDDFADDDFDDEFDDDFEEEMEDEFDEVGEFADEFNGEDVIEDAERKKDGGTSDTKGS